MSLHWQHCRIRERFSSGPDERGGPVWWVELELAASAPEWSRLTATIYLSGTIEATLSPYLLDLHISVKMIAVAFLVMSLCSGRV